MPQIYYDRLRHLICVPYDREHLHKMAATLGIKRCWFHARPYPHYDLPKRYGRPANATEVSPRELVRIIRRELESGSKLRTARPNERA